MRGATAEFTCDACGPPDDGRSMAPRVPSLAQSLGVYDLREGGGCKKHGRWGSRRSTMAARPRRRPSPVNKKRAVVNKKKIAGGQKILHAHSVLNYKSFHEFLKS